MLLRVEVAAFHSGLNRLVSVALFVASRRLGVTQHPALWSPDFPLASWNSCQRLSGQLRVQFYRIAAQAAWLRERCGV